LKLIGKGAQGSVFLAERTTTSERFAAKVILKREVVMEKNELEQTILSIVKDHPFIVTLEHVFENDRRMYFFMKYVEGHDLKGHLAK
jgi:serine/threonine protein kinase